VITHVAKFKVPTFLRRKETKTKRHSYLQIRYSTMSAPIVEVIAPPAVPVDSVTTAASLDMSTNQPASANGQLFSTDVANQPPSDAVAFLNDTSIIQAARSSCAARGASGRT